MRASYYSFDQLAFQILVDVFNWEFLIPPLFFERDPLFHLAFITFGALANLCLRFPYRHNVGFSFFLVYTLCFEWLFSFSH